MKTNSYRIYLLFLTAFTLLLSSCINYDTPKPDGNSELKKFGFSTRGDVNLSIDYKAVGYKALIEVYSEFPMQNDSVTKKEGIAPIFAAYTDDNGKLNTSMYIPTATSKVYIFTDTWGLPQYVEAEVTGQGVTYDAAAARKNRVAKRASTRAPYSYVIGNKQPYAIQNRTDIMSLGRFDEFGYVYNWGGGEPTDYTPNYVTQTPTYKGETVGAISARAQAYFDSYTGKRHELLKPADVTNIKMKTEGSLDVVFLAERAAYKNVFGYYYYEAGNAPVGREALKAMKKYVIIPYVDAMAGIESENTFRLKYFGKDGNAEASEIFPTNTVVGWFIISNGFRTNGKFNEWNSYSNAYNFFFTNDEDKNMRFVAIKDTKTGIIVLGCEDREEAKFNRDQEDYCDMLFFVKTNDGTLEDSDKVEIPDEKPEKPEASLSITGLYAFEDIWPARGDYDMNDVAITYNRTIKFDGTNKVTAIEETFKFIQEPNAAKHTNFFAYQVKEMGNVTLPAGCVKEDATNSIIYTTSSIESKMNDSFTVTRTFSGSVNQSDVLKDINPYIIVKDGEDKLYSSADRKEVHLPTYKATTKANQKTIGTGKDAFYMNSDGTYPFAIEIPKLDFKLSKERIAIDESYPRFRTWTKSFGKTDKDWYNDTPAVK